MLLQGSSGAIMESEVKSCVIKSNSTACVVSGNPPTRNCSSICGSNELNVPLGNEEPFIARFGPNLAGVCIILRVGKSCDVYGWEKCPFLTSADFKPCPDGAEYRPRP